MRSKKDKLILLEDSIASKSEVKHKKLFNYNKLLSVSILHKTIFEKKDSINKMIKKLRFETISKSLSSLKNQNIKLMRNVKHM